MKKASTELFDLIKSLTTNEKAYFKRFAGMHKGADNSYFKLFEAIAEQSEYCEEKVKASLKNEKLVGYFSRAKKYLFDKILESMRLYNADKRVQRQLWDRYEDACFLYSRKQIKPASRLLKKIKKEAESSECWMVYVEAYRLEISIIRQSEKMAEEVRVWRKELKTALDKAYNSLHFGLVNKTMSNYWNVQTMDTMRKQYDLLHEEYLKDSDDTLKPTTIEAQINHYKSLALYYKAFKNYTKAYDILIKTVELFEANPIILNKNALFYFFALDNLFSVYCEKFEDIKAKENLEKVEHYFLRKNTSIFAHDYVIMNISPRHYFNKLVYCFKFAKHEEGLDAVKKSIETSKGYIHLISEVNLMLLANMYFLFYIIHQQWDEALFWINYLLSKSNTHHKGARLNAQLWQLLIHLELENDQLLVSMLRNTVRSWQQNEVYSPYLQSLVKVIRQQLNQEYAECWKDIRDLAWKSAQKTQYQGVDTIYAFAQSRLQKRNFEEIRRELIEAYIQRKKASIEV